MAERGANQAPSYPAILQSN